MEFEKRLEKAVERGYRTSDTRSEKKAQHALSEEDFKRMHSDFRLQLSEHIEHCLKRLPGHFPGFSFESIVSERGWGAKVSRDDIEVSRDRQRTNQFSRLEMVVRPFSSYHVLELTAKGTIRNKEIYNRTHYQRLGETDLDSFTEMIDLWVLEYAELFAARN